MSTVLQSDNELWLLITQDNQPAFEALYNRHVKKIYEEISRRIKDREDAEDLTQDVFISLWEKRSKIRPSGEIFPYLYGMAINRVLNYYRTNKIHEDFIQLWEELPEDIADLAELSLAFRQAHTLEMESLLDAAIRSLPARMRQIYQLRYEKNHSIAEIAESLSISPNTVHNQLKSVRKRFIAALKNTSYFFF